MGPGGRQRGGDGDVRTVRRWTRETAELVLAWATNATELEPDFPYWWMRLGIRQMALEGYDVARPSFERALDLQPYHPISLQMLAAIANQQGDADLLRRVSERLEELGLPIGSGPTTDGHMTTAIANCVGVTRSLVSVRRLARLLLVIGIVAVGVRALQVSRPVHR